jgi:hypothetical protein
MIMTINSIYVETLDQITKNEHRLEIVVVSKLKGLARELTLKEDIQNLTELHNTLVRLDGIMKKANQLYLGNEAED